MAQVRDLWDYICSNIGARSERRGRGWAVEVGEDHNEVHQASLTGDDDIEGRSLRMLRLGKTVWHLN